MDLLSGTFLGIILGNSFGNQLWDCGEQLWGCMGLWRAALGQLQGSALGSNFWEQLWGTTLGSNFVNNFLAQLWGAAMQSSFR